MYPKALMSSLMVFVQGAALAQCTVTIPSTAIVVSTGLSIAGINQHYWICEGATISGAGSNHTFYLETGAEIDGMAGNSKNIYMKTGSSATICTSSAADTLYYEAGAQFTCTGSPVMFLCDEIIFDYTNAPVGCDVLTTLSNQTNSTLLDLFPNPAMDRVRVTIPRGSTAPAYYEVFAPTGKRVLYGLLGASAEVDVTTLVPAAYAVRVRQGGHLYTRTLVVQ
jgi:hypothetical protein